MSFLKTICLTFSMYSRIPMPILNYEEKDMRYTFLAFPLVGAVIGALQIAWYELAVWLGIGIQLYAAIATALPLWVTGGFHMDGFLDTTDALSSHREKEKKLEILKDSHVGAFAVIWTGVYLLVNYGLLTQIFDRDAVFALAATYLLSRITSGFAAVTFPSATHQGTLAGFAKASEGKAVKIGLFIWLLAVFTALALWQPRYGVWFACLLLSWMIYYYRMSKREFGGITGDLAGWYLQTVELLMLAGIAVLNLN